MHLRLPVVEDCESVAVLSGAVVRLVPALRGFGHARSRRSIQQWPICTDHQSLLVRGSLA